MMDGMAKRSAAMSSRRSVDYDALAAGMHGGAPEYRGLTMPPRTGWPPSYEVQQSTRGQR